MEFPDEFYRNLCCTKTLYSTDEGFFKEFVDIMLEKVDSHWIENTFKRQVSEVDKIRLCCTDSKVRYSDQFSYLSIFNILSVIVFKYVCSKLRKNLAISLKYKRKFNFKIQTLNPLMNATNDIRIELRNSTPVENE